jgi:hypothetical protein
MRQGDEECYDIFDIQETGDTIFLAFSIDTLCVQHTLQCIFIHLVLSYDRHPPEVEESTYSNITNVSPATMKSATKLHAISAFMRIGASRWCCD